eukprot:6280146-Prymnesium_polylepis.1
MREARATNASTHEARASPQKPAGHACTRMDTRVFSHVFVLSRARRPCTCPLPTLAAHTRAPLTSLPTLRPVMAVGHTPLVQRRAR